MTGGFIAFGIGVWLIDTFYRIANYAGFSIEERIVLRDKKSGKIYN